MAVVTTVDIETAMGAPPGGGDILFPFPSRRWHQKVTTTMNRVSYDAAFGPAELSAAPVVCYFHGSGSTTYLEGPLVQAIVDAGYALFQSMYFCQTDTGTGDLLYNPPFRYGYNANDAPLVTQNNLKLAAWVGAALKTATALSLAGDIILLGQSMGSSASLAFASYGYPSAGFNFDTLDLAVDNADYCEELITSGRLKGMVLNGATMGSTGTKTWNDVNRNINSFTNMLPLLKVKTLMLYGNLDALATPDYVKYLQASLPRDKEVYLLSAGERPHNWINDDATNAGIVVDWINQVYNGTPILSLDGSPAVQGPHVP